MVRDRTSWSCLPPEIRNEIIHLLPIHGGKCSQLVTVCKAWQSIIEPINFAEISLTVPRLADLDSRAILFRKRNHIRYIWFRVELEQWGYSRDVRPDVDLRPLGNMDDQFTAVAFESLFTALSAWEPRGDLVLDISVYSPSDDELCLEKLRFCLDSIGKRPSRHGHDRGTTLKDPAHGCVAGQQVLAPTYEVHEFAFQDILDERFIVDQEHDMQWWGGLPSVPVVGVVLLRQQTRRRWRRIAFANLLTRFPNMKELCNQTLIETFASTKLCKLTIFQNFNECRPGGYFCYAIRKPNPDVSRKLAGSSLQLTMLSASFMADAGHFFAARQASWTWDNLTSLTLTSRVLTNKADRWDINDMLGDAAAAALKMPRLDTMELWNGRRGVAMLFRYQRAQDGQPAIITVRGTSELALGNMVIQAWGAVAHRHCQGKVVVQTSLIGRDKILCHGDAIRQLGLLTEVARPVSLRQILPGHWFRSSLLSAETSRLSSALSYRDLEHVGPGPLEHSLATLDIS